MIGLDCAFYDQEEFLINQVSLTIVRLVCLIFNHFICSYARLQAKLVLCHYSECLHDVLDCYYADLMP